MKAGQNDQKYATQSQGFKKDSQILTVYGCLFSPQMRAVCSLLELNDIQFQYQDQNIFDQNPQDISNVSKGIKALNQNLYLTENNKNIVGDSCSLLKYISLTKRLGKKGQEVFIDENFYPKKKVSTDRKILIDSILEYIEQVVKRNTHRLTKVIIQSLLFSQQKKGLRKSTDDNIFDASLFDNNQNSQDLKEEKMIFFDMILHTFEKHFKSQNNIPVLSQSPITQKPLEEIVDQLQKEEGFTQREQEQQTLANVYIVGQDYSLADILMFHELQNVFGVLHLANLNDSILNQKEDWYKLAIGIKYPFLSSWYKNLEASPVMKQYQILFEKVYLDEFIKKITEQ